jgi:hypothetical protein
MSDETVDVGVGVGVDVHVHVDMKEKRWETRILSGMAEMTRTTTA